MHRETPMSQDSSEIQARHRAQLKDVYDYIVVGAGASGSVNAAELSKTGAEVLVVESGGTDSAPTITNPSIWFYNVGSPLDWNRPIAPRPQLNDRKFNMALGRVLGGGSSINAMVWSRGMALDYDNWEHNGAAGWAFEDVLPTFKAQEDWEGGANQWLGVGNANELKRMGIAPVTNLPGVGQNLQDHVLLSGVVYKYRGKMPDRPADSNAVEAEVYLSSGLSSHPADINLVLEQLPIATPEASARFGALPKEGFTIAPALVQPTSRGQVRLANADWRAAPIIEANHLGTDHDLAAIVRAIELARE